MIVVDTNVVSELMRPAPSPAVATWARTQDPRELYTTSITLAEIGYGIERLPDGHRKELLRSTADEVFSAYAEHVLPFDASAAAEYGKIVGDRDRLGAPIDGFDAQIASICRAHHASVATRNVRHFENTGIEINDPWDDAT